MILHITAALLIRCTAGPNKVASGFMFILYTVYCSVFLIHDGLLRQHAHRVSLDINQL